MFKVFEKTKQEEILNKLYVHVDKPKEDKLREILSGIYLQDGSLQDEILEDLFYFDTNIR